MRAMVALAGGLTAVPWAIAQSKPSGVDVCSSCHPAQTKNYHLNGMANALQRANKSDILRSAPLLEFSEDRYRTVITRDDEGSGLTITDGTDMLTARILWAFGLGKAGQTYVFEHRGELYESRVSYYSELKRLSLTLGAEGAKPTSLVEAAGRRMDAADIRQCFGCHSTGAVQKDTVVWDAMTPGILCENCHGDPTQHSKARQSGSRSGSKMRSLTELTAEEMNELCGACHRTWAQVAEMKLKGPLNVRFQPYRITNSKCFDADDRRIACTACHDPHTELLKSAVAYDPVCLTCHANSPHASSVTPKKAGYKSRKVCSSGRNNCVTCHMPKIALPGAHYAFSDHQIRIAKAGDAYPN